MNTATETTTTPPANPQLAGPRTPYAERVSPQARAALAEVAAGAPSITDLAKQWAAVEVAYDLCDESQAVAARKQANDAAVELLDARREALMALIATLPPVTIQDAACIVAGMTVHAGRLAASVHTPDEAEEVATRLERMALGVLPIVAKAAGLDMAAMGWSDDLRLARYLGAGVLS